MSIQLESLRTCAEKHASNDAHTLAAISMLFSLTDPAEEIAKLLVRGVKATIQPEVPQTVAPDNKIHCHYLLPKLNRNCKNRARKGSLVCSRHASKESEIIVAAPAPIVAAAPPSTAPIEPQLTVAPISVEQITTTAPATPIKVSIFTAEEEAKLAKMPEPFFTDNGITILDKFKRKEAAKPGCAYILKSGTRRGEQCGRRLVPNFRYCSIHRKCAPAESSSADITLPRCKWRRGAFWDKLVKQPKIPRLESASITLHEDDIPGDDDSVIDEAIAVPKFVPRECIYYDESNAYSSATRLELCGQPVSGPRGSYMCAEHKKHAKKFSPNLSLWNSVDSYATVMRQFPDINIIGGKYWFPRLNLFAHMSECGPVVVGKAWCAGVYCESLDGCGVSRDRNYRVDADLGRDDEESDLWGGFTFTDEEKEKKHLARFNAENDVCLGTETSATLIRRCHNNGLLYKVLPQNVVHQQYDLPKNIEAEDGFGMTSFEQMIEERPTLYIKYWRIWNGQIERARAFLNHQGKSLVDLNSELGIEKAIDWDKYEQDIGMRIGMFNVVVPPPTLDQVTAKNFNPFRYCKEWVEEHGTPSERERPHFPPMYLLYPFPESEMEDLWIQQHDAHEEEKLRLNKRLLHHYHQTGHSETAEAWMQWLKFGKHGGIFGLFPPGSRSDVPIQWRTRMPGGRSHT